MGARATSRGNRYEWPGGTVVPRVNIGAIRGGEPWMILTNPEVCMLYLDIRTAPGQDGGEIRHELRDLLDEVGLEGNVEQFVNRDGYEATGHRAARRTRSTRRTRNVFGERVRDRDSPECSMWRDHNVYNEVGHPRAHLRAARRSQGTGRTPWPRRTCCARRASTR